MGEPSRFFSVFNKKKGSRELKFCEGNKEEEEEDLEARRLRKPAVPEEIIRQFSLAEIKAATYNFHQDLIIGNGGFGTVYKGFFSDGNLVVAVKRLRGESTQGFIEFRTEVLLLCQLRRHQNLLPLIGFCDEKGEMILVYEYMRNGTLRDHLYGSGYDPLPWKQRLQICIGAARGLHYLHTGAKQSIIHRDIKSSNILLDDKWICKLFDFGLSKLRPRSKSRTLKKIHSKVKGSFGYLDPEYFKKMEVREKCDVYSFGIVLLEVLCGRTPLNPCLSRNEVSLLELVNQSIREGTIYNTIDPYLKGRIAPECFKIFLDIACSCTRPEGDSRPEMGEVELILERALELQEEADSDTVRLAAHGEYMYEEASIDPRLYSVGAEGESSNAESGSASNDIGSGIESIASVGMDPTF